MSNARIVGAKFKIIDGGTPTVIPVAQTTITRAKSEPLKWSVTIPDGTCQYFTDLTKPDLQPVGTPTKTVQIEIFSGAATRTYSDLILLDRKYNADPNGGYTLTLSGADYSQVLFRDNQTMETFTSTNTHIAIPEILTEYGFVSYDLDFPDFYLMQMDFQKDRPINRIQTILNEVGAFWRCEGKRFIIWIPSIRTASDFHYQDSAHIYSINVNEQVLNLVNKVKVCRVTKNAYQAFRQAGTTCGRFGGKLSGVFMGLSYLINNDVGSLFYDIDYFRNSQWVGHLREQLESENNPVYNNGEVDEVAFTVTPHDAALFYNWDIQFTGIPIEYVGSGINPNAIYEYEDTASIAAYGELPASNIESNFTATNELAQMKAEAFMREQGRLKRTLDFETIINPYLELDETIRITEKVSGIDNYFNVESVTTTINGADGTDSLQVVEYEG